MDQWLTKELAQKIVKKMMLDIPYSINIMNEKGIIIGSGDPQRVGTLHQGAVKALKTGKMVEIYDDHRYEKKGTNEPLVVNSQPVGVIGITGDPQAVRPFCKLVKTAVSLLIEQNMLMGNQEAERNRKAAFLETILNEQKNYSQELIREAERYRIHLHEENSVVLVKPKEKSSCFETIDKPFPFFKKPNENLYILILQNRKDIQKIAESIWTIDPFAIVTAGLHGLNIASGYRQAKLCLSVCEKLHLQNRFFDYADWKFPAELSQTRIFQETFEETLNLPDLYLETLTAFISHNGNPAETARALMIHRNTLYYRLGRIKELTGKNPFQLFDLFELAYRLLRR